MGFMDKVKATVQDVTDTVSKTIDNEKVDSKMREESRKADKAFQEIGEIVVKRMMSGEEFDVSMVTAQYSSAIAAMQAITDYSSQRTEPSTSFEKYIITDNYVMPNDDNTVTPEPAPQSEPIAVPQPEEAPKIEAPATKTEEQYSDWVDVTDDKFWKEDSSEESTADVQSEKPEAQEKTPEPESAPQKQSEEGSSMLSRMQSYKSSNFQGENINKK